MGKIQYTRLRARLEQAGITSYTCKRDNLIGEQTWVNIRRDGRIDTGTIAKLCDALRCQPGDILEYVPDDTDTN